MAKSFLFSFSFSLFSFISLDLLLQGYSMGRYHVTQSQSHKDMTLVTQNIMLYVTVTTHDEVVT